MSSHKDSQLIVGAGCFWGVEKLLQETPGVTETIVGYCGGHTENPTYRDVCDGHTGHVETVKVHYDPEKITLSALVATVLEAHDPTQGNRQGNDIGEQYRSVFFTMNDDDTPAIQRIVENYGKKLEEAGYGSITTDVRPLSTAGNGIFYPAEEYHQKYLVKNPEGYCPIHATGIPCGN